MGSCQPPIVHLSICAPLLPFLCSCRFCAVSGRRWLDAAVGPLKPPVCNNAWAWAVAHACGPATSPCSHGHPVVDQPLGDAIVLSAFSMPTDVLSQEYRSHYDSLDEDLQTPALSLAMFAACRWLFARVPLALRLAG